MKEQKSKYIILFDGVCNFCNSSVNFAMDRDPSMKFKFASLQSEQGQFYLKKFNLPVDQMNSLVLVTEERYWMRSDAVLEIARNLKGLWPALYFFKIIPGFIRNPIYDLIARNRYKWFGKREACRLPTAADKARFL
jgi:predicted DCC family thiol-disulfide oxidoreductase YuxK